MDWIRGERLGCGSFGTVNLAKPRSYSPQIPSLMAVKSCEVLCSASLKNEKMILDELRDCPEIVSCYGESFSYENGEKLYNVLMEFASGGALADKIRNSGDKGLPKFEVRRYTKSLLKGLNYIHKFGYVHCDIKLQNILLGQDGGVKIADFGLSKKAGEKRIGVSRCELRGTPLYMSPEMVTGGEQEAAADIWALGCVVAEMITGVPVWRCDNVAALMMRIGVADELPQIPNSLSPQGKDFLGKCFVKDPCQRWTAEMLLNHPFVVDEQCYDTTVTLEDRKYNVASPSPRCPFDFPEWDAMDTSEITYLSSPGCLPESDSCFSGDRSWSGGSWSISRAERLWGLVSDQDPDWSVSDDWITVR